MEHIYHPAPVLAPLHRDQATRSVAFPDTARFHRGADPPPTSPTLAHGQFLPDVGHSAIQTVFTTFVALVSRGAGWLCVRSRPTSPGARFINGWFILVYILPPAIFLLPLYVIYLHIGLLNTYPGLILAYLTGLLPFTVWLMRLYFMDVPRELDEAAWIDGCSRLGTLWRVVLPMVWPGLTTVGLLIALGSLGRVLRCPDHYRPADPDRAGSAG